MGDPHFAVPVKFLFKFNFDLQPDPQGQQEQQRRAQARQQMLLKKFWVDLGVKESRGQAGPPNHFPHAIGRLREHFIIF